MWPIKLLALIVSVFLLTAPAFADGVLTPAATEGAGLPAGGSVNDCILNTAPGTGTWQACPGAAGGDDVSVNGGATVNPDFATTGSDLTLTNTANVITFTLKSGLTVTNWTMVNPALGTPASGVATNLTGTATGLTAGTATVANSGDSATSFFSSGTIEDARLPTSMANKAMTGSLNIPNSTSLPGTCTVGDLYFDSDATSGQRLYACESTNTWALQGDGGGGGGLASTDIDTCTELAAIWTDETGTCGGPVLSQGPTIADLVMTGSANIPNSTSLPGTCSVGNIYVDTDATSGQRLYLCESTDTWVLQADGVGASTLDQAFDGGKVIQGATSLANAMCVGDGTRQICFYGDATLGPVIRPQVSGGDTNTAIRCWTDKDCLIYDVEGDAPILTIDPDAASVNAMYQFGANYRPRKSIWFGAGSLSTDGTQCAAPAEVTPVANGPKVWSIICADNAASAIYGSARMPDAWDGGTVTFTIVYQQTAADTAIFNGDIACQARSNGEVPTDAFGTTQALDDAAVVGSGSNDMTTSAAVTCAGTGLAGGDMLYWEYLVSTDTTTAMATLHILGFNMEYTVSSLSD